MSRRVHVIIVYQTVTTANGPLASLVQLAALWLIIISKAYLTNRVRGLKCHKPVIIAAELKLSSERGCMCDLSSLVTWCSVKYLINSFIHLIHSFTHSFIHSFIHSLIHSLITPMPKQCRVPCEAKKTAPFYFCNIPQISLYCDIVGTHRPYTSLAFPSPAFSCSL